MKHAIALAALAALATGCAATPEYTAPWAMLATGNALTADAKVRNVLLATVDGKKVEEDKAVIATGRRRITVEVASRGTETGATSVLELDAQPCVRYWLGARRPTAAGKPWETVVVSEDALGDCERRFGMKAAPVR